MNGLVGQENQEVHFSSLKLEGVLLHPRESKSQSELLSET